MDERFFVYVQHVGVVAAGATVTDVPLQTDADAPFVLRGRSIGLLETSAVTVVAQVNAMYTRYRDSSDKHNSTDLLPVQFEMPNGGSMGPSPVYPQKPYPAGAVILADVFNSNAVDVDVTLYYHGVKLYPDGTYPLTYPAKCSMLAYSYTLPGPGRPPLIIQPAGAGSFIQDYTLTIQGDADYVFRAGNGGLRNFTALAGFRNLFVTMKDHDRKPFSSGPVHINHMFAASQGAGVGSTFHPLAGDWTPGLFVPEIWVRKNDMLYFDFLRQDNNLPIVGSLPTALPVDLQFVFFGDKVFV
jgi:hypothetical protein